MENALMYTVSIGQKWPQNKCTAKHELVEDHKPVCFVFSPISCKMHYLSKITVRRAFVMKSCDHATHHLHRNTEDKSSTMMWVLQFQSTFQDKTMPNSNVCSLITLCLAENISHSLSRFHGNLVSPWAPHLYDGYLFVLLIQGHILRTLNSQK